MMNSEVATLVGLHIGDGYLGEHKVKWKNKIWVNRKWTLNAGYDYDFALNVKNLVENLGYKARIYPKDKIYFVVQSTSIWRLIKIFFPIKKYAETVDIPKEFIKKWGLAKNVLRGIFSCDGCVGFTNNYKNVYISFDTKSKRLANSIYKLLKEQDFNAHFYQFKGGNMFSVRIFKKSDMKRFMKEINSFNPKHYERFAGVR